MAEIDSIDGLQDQVEALEASLGDAAVVASAFDGELKRVRQALADTGKDVGTLEKGLSRGLRRAFDGVAFDGMKLSDAMRTVAQSMINTAYAAAVKPVTDHFGGMIAQGVGNLVSGILPFEKGGAFSQGKVVPFATGGVVTSPTMFPMRGATGLMGEAGPEAIMPLARGADGRLGVKAAGGQNVSIVMNITTPDVEGFRRSQGQIAAQMGRALGRGQRNR